MRQSPAATATAVTTHQTTCSATVTTVVAAVDTDAVVQPQPPRNRRRLVRPTTSTTVVVIQPNETHYHHRHYITTATSSMQQRRPRQQQQQFHFSRMLLRSAVALFVITATCSWKSWLLLTDAFSVPVAIAPPCTRRAMDTFHHHYHHHRLDIVVIPSPTTTTTTTSHHRATKQIRRKVLLYGSIQPPQENDGISSISSAQKSPLMDVDSGSSVNNNNNVIAATSGETSYGAGIVAKTTMSTTSPGISNSSNNPPFLVTLDDMTQYSYTDAIQRTIGWVSAAILFGTALWITNDATTGQEFFAGYLVEQSLSIDNLFVFLLLFDYFQVPLQYQDRVLNWGIYGAVVMRAVMIGIGSVALQKFHIILLFFAAILVYSSASFFIKAAADNDDDETKEDPSQNSIVQFSRSLFPSTDVYDEDRFFTIAKDGIRTATPLFICMIAVEISDVVFAIDSIPAVFGVTENPLIVFSSNIFAIMGLRSLYTILSKAATDLKYLEPAVAIVLGFIGSKMIAEYFDYIIPTNIALMVVATVLSTGVGLSVWEQQQQLQQSQPQNLTQTNEE